MKIRYAEQMPLLPASKWLLLRTLYIVAPRQQYNTNTWIQQVGSQYNKLIMSSDSNDDNINEYNPEHYHFNNPSFDDVSFLFGVHGCRKVRVKWGSERCELRIQYRSTLFWACLPWSTPAPRIFTAMTWT